MAESPRSAALFAAHGDNFEHYFYYFTPTAALIAPSLIHAYLAEPVEAPKRDSVFQRVEQYAADEEFR
jgi:hypothetical protein